MPITSKKSFLSGYLTGQALRRSVRGMPGTNGMGGTPSADFDALSFKSGLAAGLCGDGWMVPYAPKHEISGFKTSSFADWVSGFAINNQNSIPAVLYSGIPTLLNLCKQNNFNSLEDLSAAGYTEQTYYDFETASIQDMWEDGYNLQDSAGRVKIPLKGFYLTKEEPFNMWLIKTITEDDGRVTLEARFTTSMSTNSGPAMAAYVDIKAGEYSLSRGSANFSGFDLITMKVEKYENDTWVTVASAEGSAGGGTNTLTFSTDKDYANQTFRIVFWWRNNSMKSWGTGSTIYEYVTPTLYCTKRKNEEDWLVRDNVYIWELVSGIAAEGNYLLIKNEQDIQNPNACFSPKIFDADRMIFIDPEEGNEYAVSGKVYFNGATYQSRRQIVLSIPSGTMEYQGISVLSIRIAYGNDSVVVTRSPLHYSFFGLTTQPSGSITDEYKYVSPKSDGDF